MRTFAVYGITDGRCNCHKGKDCPSPGKHPIGRWRTNPKAPKDGDNVGIATGEGFWVLDIDADKGGIDSLNALVEVHGDLPLTKVCATGGGGAHYYFKGGDIKNSANKIAQGIDVRGEGGFVVAPPSAHVNGGEYSWVNNADIAEAPEWLYALATTGPTGDRDRETSKAAREARSRIPTIDRILRAAAYMEKVPPAVQGQGGDEQTFKAAQIGFSFGIAEDDWFKWLKVNYNPRCQPSWPEQDLRKKVANGYEYSTQSVFGWRLADEAVLPKQVDPEAPVRTGAFFYVSDSAADLDIAQAWLEVVDRDLISVGGGVLQYEKGHWTPVDRSVLEKWVADEIHGAYFDIFGKTQRLGLSVNRQEAIAKAIQKMVTVVDPEQFDRWKRAGVATRDGVWVVDKKGNVGRLDHDRTIAGAQFLDVDLSGEPDCPRWQKFLADLFEGAEDAQQRVDFLQEFLGVAMCGRATTFAKSVWLLGSGSNGKSTLLDAIGQSLFTEDRISYTPPHSWRDPFARIQLRGSLLNIVSEIEDKNLFNSADMKSIISGDTTRARNLRQDFISFAPEAGHIFAANSMPPVGDGTHGFWRRVVILRMDRVFAEVAHNRLRFKDELAEEQAGIVRWALIGAMRALRRGHYAEPDSVGESVTEWREDSNNVAAFIRSCTEPADNEFTTLKGLYTAFCLWYGDQSGGDSPKLHKRRFSKKVGELGISRARKSYDRGFNIRILNKDQWVDYGN